MAVQQNRKTPSKRGMRRAHDALTGKTVSTDSHSGERHLRHHVTKDGLSVLALPNRLISKNKT